MEYVMWNRKKAILMWYKKVDTSFSRNGNISHWQMP